MEWPTTGHRRGVASRPPSSATTCTAWQTFPNQSLRRVRNATLPPPTASVTTGADVVAITVAGGGAAFAVAKEVSSDIVVSTPTNTTVNLPRPTAPSYTCGGGAALRRREAMRLGPRARSVRRAAHRPARRSPSHSRAGSHAAVRGAVSALVVVRRWSVRRPRAAATRQANSYRLTPSAPARCSGPAAAVGASASSARARSGHPHRAAQLVGEEREVGAARRRPRGCGARGRKARHRRRSARCARARAPGCAAVDRPLGRRLGAAVLQDWGRPGRPRGMAGRRDRRRRDRSRGARAAPPRPQRPRRRWPSRRRWSPTPPDRPGGRRCG